MRDLDVRLATKAHLMNEHEDDGDTIIVEEMGIWHGSVRVDVAVINGEIGGYELKSARDTLTRLPFQAELYSQVFDKMHLVCAENHLNKALRLIPEWWGVLIAHDINHAVQLHDFRPACANPDIQPIQLARLLWKEESIQILQKFDCLKGVKSASREKIAERLSTSLPLLELQREVRTALKKRNGWLRNHSAH